MRFLPVARRRGGTVDPGRVQVACAAVTPRLRECEAAGNESRNDIKITACGTNTLAGKTSRVALPYFLASSISSITRSGFIFRVGRGKPSVSPLAWNPLPSTSTKMGL